MALPVKKFVHVPLFVDAVQVTRDNMDEVAQWCEGVVNKDDKNSMFIRVVAIRPAHDRQTRAYPRDWVLKTKSGFKVYRPDPFKRDFDEVEEVPEA